MKPLVYARPRLTKTETVRQPRVRLSDENFALVEAAAFISGKSYSKVANEMITHLYESGLLEIEGDHDEY